MVFQWRSTQSYGNLFLIFIILSITLSFNKEVNKMFNDLADLIIDQELAYTLFSECKLLIKNQNPQYLISKNEEK